MNILQNNITTPLSISYSGTLAPSTSKYFKCVPEEGKFIILNNLIFSTECSSNGLSSGFFVIFGDVYPRENQTNISEVSRIFTFYEINVTRIIPLNYIIHYPKVFYLFFQNSLSLSIDIKSAIDILSVGLFPYKGN